MSEEVRSGYAKTILPCGCGANFSVQQYRNEPEAWDGYSEEVCNKCGKRFGRWSRRELIGDDREKKSLRYGGHDERKD